MGKGSAVDLELLEAESMLFQESGKSTEEVFPLQRATPLQAPLKEQELSKLKPNGPRKCLKYCDIEKYTQSWAMILDRPRQPTTYTRTARSTHREPNRSGNPAATREHAHQLLLGRWECTSSWRQLESLQLCCQACWISIEGENGSKLTLPQK